MELDEKISISRQELEFVMNNHDVELQISDWISKKKDRTRNMYRIYLDHRGLFLRVKGTKEKEFLIDYNDKHLLEEYNFCCVKNKTGKSYYVKTGNKSILLHNLVMKHFDFSKYTVDHINRDGLNNRKNNIRLATKQQQGSNRSIRQDNTSGYKGVFFVKQDQAYRSQWIDENGKQKQSPRFHLKDYSSKEAKRLAYEYRQRAIKNLPHYN